jgi:hypothetical protein
MKKVVIAFLVLAFAPTSFAVSFSGSDLGAGKMRLSFDVPSGEVLRGVALRFTTTAGTATIAGTSAVTNIDPRFNVFPDYAFSVPAGFTVTPRIGHPLANPNGPGVLTAFPASTFVLCMGSLDETGHQGGVTGTGVLCEIQYFGVGGPACILIEGDTLRGGAVVGDNVTQPSLFMSCPCCGTLEISSTDGGNVITPGEGVFPCITGCIPITVVADPGYVFVNWTGTAVAAGKVVCPTCPSTMVCIDDCGYYTLQANFALIPETITTPIVTKTTAPPAIAGRVNGGRVETFVASGAVSSLGHALEYQFTWGDGAVGPWGTATQTHTYTYGGAGITKTAPYAYNATVQARCVTHPAILSAVSPVLTLTSECVKSSAVSVYTNWTTVNRPDCWCCQRNCQGDVDCRCSGLGLNRICVDARDLAVFSAAYNKPQSLLLPCNYLGIPCICADNNRIGQGIGNAKVWVRADDLQTFSGHYLKPISGYPPCPQTNYWYWTN